VVFDRKKGFARLPHLGIAAEPAMLIGFRS
jgi:hypothetical protein